MAIIVLSSFIRSAGQKSTATNAENIYKFNTETARSFDNALVGDGTFLYDIRCDGGLNGGGTLFRIKPDGSDYSVLFNFTDNTTGYNPVGTLFLSGTALYGMTIFGGEYNKGVIFKIETNGTGFQKLLDFDSDNGALPYGSLIISGTTIYGLSQQGGTGGNGLVFKLQSDGTGYQKLLTFDNTNGAAPTGSLTLSGTTLYGTTLRGGTHDLGVVFAIGTDGTGYRKLVDFEQNIGSHSFGSLVLSGTTLYGTTSQGGPQWMGTLYRVETDGSAFEVIHYFGSDPGINPLGKPLLIGSKIYGMTANGGMADGVVYSVDTDGSNYTVLHSFIKSDGANPTGSLTLIDDKLYAHIPGGVKNYGVIFSMNQDGSGFQKIKDFDATNKGYEPRGALVLTAASGFGITYQGGEYNKGVIYRVDRNGTAYEVIHDFDGDMGAFPEASMTLDGKTLYGITKMGGMNGSGTLFKIDTTGLGFEVLTHFSDDIGSFPVGSLADDGENTLYGMTSAGAIDNKGTVFKLDKNTKVLTTLYSFEDTDAIRPSGAITLADSKLYGMSLGGVGDGVVFSLNLDGSGFTKILDRSSSEAGRYPNSLTVSGATIYGTMTQGGQNDWGTVFRVQTDGTGFQKLVDFVYANGGESNGGIPTGATLVIGDSILYGMTKVGGPHDSGVAYSVRTDGSDYTILLNFDEVNSSPGGRVNSSGMPMRVEGSLAFEEGIFYTALTLQSGEYKSGTILRFTHDAREEDEDDDDDESPGDITGIEDSKSSDISVYPNPTNSVIRLPLDFKIADVYIVDALGNRMNARPIDDAIDVSHFSRGIYFVVAGSRRYRFIKL